jgi:8-oxo-dGTP pyrophosphatase MutT (NUDIX family)
MSSIFLDPTTLNNTARIQRVRAILLTPSGDLMFIKRIKPGKPAPYWLAPGGGVEACDRGLHDALHRELSEELGARITVLSHEFALCHEKAGKHLEEHFFVCRLLDYNLALRHGPEFDDPSRGKFLPDVVPLTRYALNRIYIKTDPLRVWLLENLRYLRSIVEGFDSMDAAG